MSISLTKFSQPLTPALSFIDSLDVLPGQGQRSVDVVARLAAYGLLVGFDLAEGSDISAAQPIRDAVILTANVIHDNSAYDPKLANLIVQSLVKANAIVHSDSSDVVISAHQRVAEVLAGKVEEVSPVVAVKVVDQATPGPDDEEEEDGDGSAIKPIKPQADPEKAGQFLNKLLANAAELQTAEAYRALSSVGQSVVRFFQQFQPDVYEEYRKLKYANVPPSRAEKVKAYQFVLARFAEIAGAKANEIVA